MFSLAVWLVFIQDDRVPCAAAGPAQPHVGLAGGSFSRFLQHLQRRFVPMQNRLVAKIPVQHIIDRAQPGI